MEKALEQQPANCLKIALFGPESTGKTTLASELAVHFHTQWVPEYSRAYLQKKWDEEQKICEISDLIPIAKGQIKLENELAKKANRVLFCDTNVRQTYEYGKAYFKNFENKALKECVEKHHYDLYFLTQIDVPWEADDLRDKPNEREQMLQLFKASLDADNINYVILEGNKKQRLKKAITIVEQLLEKPQMDVDK
ncbi:AAA family ATPase [Mesonia sp. K7]|uniref:AAA family ATPase n=1 Tax=Mesonia sp. K7 TaxID=2218606 RepID=UPI000DA717F9|nr:ATP-binding protein [Mesonia sp. K7]PZD78943.1 nicotinate-nucleotide adenylyltransferase [Mesonia sp. K7]